MKRIVRLGLAVTVGGVFGCSSNLPDAQPKAANPDAKPKVHRVGINQGGAGAPGGGAKTAPALKD